MKKQQSKFVRTVNQLELFGQELPARIFKSNKKIIEIYLGVDLHERINFKWNAGYNALIHGNFNLVEVINMKDNLIKYRENNDYYFKQLKK